MPIYLARVGGRSLEQSGEYRIAAHRQDVWDGLNDPEVLARCIAGCQSMSKTGDDAYTASVKAKIGPVSATFAADLELTDIDAPQSYVINAGVKGGPAGFGKGSARVELEQVGAETLLRYEASASVGGKLAQIGSRLIDSAARKMADDFFAAFKDEMAGMEAAAPPASPAQQQVGGQWKVWVVVFAVLAVALVLVL